MWLKNPSRWKNSCLTWKRCLFIRLCDVSSNLFFEWCWCSLKKKVHENHPHLLQWSTTGYEDTWTKPYCDQPVLKRSKRFHIWMQCKLKFVRDLCSNKPRWLSLPRNNRFTLSLLWFVPSRTGRYENVTFSHSSLLLLVLQKLLTRLVVQAVL